jgi:hypothetical protein
MPDGSFSGEKTVNEVDGYMLDREGSESHASFISWPMQTGFV